MTYDVFGGTLNLTQSVNQCSEKTMTRSATVSTDIVVSHVVVFEMQTARGCTLSYAVINI